MKKLTTIFAVLVLLISSTAFANNGNNVNKTVQISFKRNFSEAINVTWESSEDYYFSSFELNNKKVTAAYNQKGELVGVSRKLQLCEIPLNVSQAIKAKFSDYVILNAVSEMLYDGQTFYYATAVGISKTLKLKCFSDGEIYVEKRIKK
ncbi:hypothetical protein BH11BAC4_BH11BAC4_21840 [soil metagenome]